MLYTGTDRRHVAARFPMLRQQAPIADARPNRSLADFVAPAESGVADHVGAFAVTAGLGVDDLVRAFEADHDDYQAIMVKALADRLAEAFAEYLHARARREWGYGAAEALSNDQLIDEEYRGIRPAFGYPACPDHTEKATLFALLDAGEVGMALTESFAMTPPASVSGIYLAHPEARYFMVGRIGQRPGRGLRRAEGDDGRGGRALAGAESRLRPGGRPRRRRLTPPRRLRSRLVTTPEWFTRLLRNGLPTTPEWFTNDSGVVRSWRGLTGPVGHVFFHPA